MLQCLDKWRLKSMDLFSTILLLIAVSGCCFAENIDFERGVFFPSDDFKLPTSLCPSFTPLCSKFNAHSLGGCWCSCPTAFSFYEHVFKCVHSSEARRSAGAILSIACFCSNGLLQSFSLTTSCFNSIPEASSWLELHLFVCSLHSFLIYWQTGWILYSQWF